MGPAVLIAPNLDFGESRRSSRAAALVRYGRLRTIDKTTTIRTGVTRTARILRLPVMFGIRPKSTVFKKIGLTCSPCCRALAENYQHEQRDEEDFNRAPLISWPMDPLHVI